MAAEHVDAIVVGARCAGSAAGAGLARAGQRVVVLASADRCWSTGHSPAP
jgi:flavin-dependent dehydrogenase